MSRTPLTFHQVCATYGITMRALRHYEALEIVTSRCEGSTRIYDARQQVRLELLLKAPTLSHSIGGGQANHRTPMTRKAPRPSGKALVPDSRAAALRHSGRGGAPAGGRSGDGEDRGRRTRLLMRGDARAVPVAQDNCNRQTDSEEKKDMKTQGFTTMRALLMAMLMSGAVQAQDVRGNDHHQ